MLVRKRGTICLFEAHMQTLLLLGLHGTTRTQVYQNEVEGFKVLQDALNGPLSDNYAEYSQDVLVKNVTALLQTRSGKERLEASGRSRKPHLPQIHLHGQSALAHIMTVELPVELLRDIFELAARNYAAANLAGCVRLLLVCRAAYTWVLPIQYKTLCIDERSQDSVFSLAANKPPDFFAPVQHLMLLWAIPPPKLQKNFLASFQHVDSVATHGRGLHFLSQAGAFSPSRLFIVTMLDPDMWSQHARALRSVTHLRVMFRVDWAANVSALPRLSHICFDTSPNDNIYDMTFTSLKANVEAMLQLPRCVRVLIRLNVWSISAWDAFVSALKTLGDERVHVFRTKRIERNKNENSDAWSTWMRSYERGIRAGVDPWNSGHAVYVPASRQ